MSAPIAVQIEVTRGVPHVHQVLSGFILLHRSREIALKVKLIPRRSSQQPFLVRATIGGVPVLYDLQDGVFTPSSQVNAALLDMATLLFARSYVAGSYGAWERRVRALGLNYHVTVRSPTSFLASHTDVPAFARATLKTVAGHSGGTRISRFEGPPYRHSDAPVVFLTRLWAPAEVPTEPPDAVAHLNAFRASIVRSLREEFGPRFVGGVAPTRYAREHYASVTVPVGLAAKRRFLALVQRASVCVTTAGIAGSNGWKLGEFVAASRPIVTERLHHGVPGDFHDGMNYLSFVEPEECAGRVRCLLDDPERTDAMSAANAAYYRAFVRPDAMVRRTVDLASAA